MKVKKRDNQIGIGRIDLTGRQRCVPTMANVEETARNPGHTGVTKRGVRVTYSSNVGRVMR